GVKQMRFGERPFPLPLIERRQINEHGYKIGMIVAELPFRNVERLPQFDLRLLVVPHLHSERAQIAEQNDDARVFRFVLLQDMEGLSKRRLSCLVSSGPFVQRSEIPEEPGSLSRMWPESFHQVNRPI